MFSLLVRIILIVFALAYGVGQLMDGHPSGFLFLVAAMMLTFGYFRHGPIRPAFSALQRGDVATARRLVATIKFPQLLSAQSRSYLHWIHGALAAQDRNFVLAEEQMQSAIDGHLRTPNDRCIAMGTLAHVVAQMDDVNRAKQILENAEQIPHNELAAEYLHSVKAEIEKAK